MEKLIHVKDASVVMEGMLKVPDGATGLVLFAHGSGSSRFSPRNNYVATVLNNAKIGTLLIDLLSQEEDAVYETRFNIDLLAERLGKVVDWLKKAPETGNLAIGLFGASTGAAAALKVAAMKDSSIKAVVSRGGRPDLAMDVLEGVKAPTLYIVGGHDYEVIKLNKAAFQPLRCEKRFEIVLGATHLFEEPGCLEQVAELAREWFEKHLH